MRMKAIREFIETHFKPWWVVHGDLVGIAVVGTVVLGIVWLCFWHWKI